MDHHHHRANEHRQIFEGQSFAHFTERPRESGGRESRADCEEFLLLMAQSARCSTMIKETIEFNFKTSEITTHFHIIHATPLALFSDSNPIVMMTNYLGILQGFVEREFERCKKLALQRPDQWILIRSQREYSIGALFSIRVHLHA
jgi:hypothetical protein